MFVTSQHAHFIGIGGIGMSGIAEILLNMGFQVSGSDLRRGAVTDRLAQLGATIYEGHQAANVAGATVVVTSSAVSPANPEVVEARARKIPVIQRAEMLAELMRLKYGIAIAGMHGKTTTTTMVASVLAAGGLDPTVVVGGRVDALGSNAKLGTTQYLVAEADESDRSFLKLPPILAVVTNLDREHMDCYRDMDDVEHAFLAFMDKVPFYGAVTACIDNAALAAILPRVHRRVFTYGTAPEADYRLEFLEAARGLLLALPGARAHRRARLVRIACPRPPQHTECHGCRSNRASAGTGVGEDRSRYLQFSRSRSPFSDSRPGTRSHSRGRLRPSPHRNPRHPCRRARVLQGAHSCRVPAASIYRAPATCSTNLAELSRMQTAYSCCPFMRPAKSRLPGITAELLTSKITSPRCAICARFCRCNGCRGCRAAREGDLIMTLGAGSVSQLGPQILAALEARM